MSEEITAPQRISYSTKQAAEALGLGESTIRRLIREGRLPARYEGSKILIKHQWLEDFFDSLPSEKQVEREVAANRRIA